VKGADIMFNIMVPYGIPLLIAAGVLLIFLFRFIARAVYLVRQAEAIVIERLGKFDRVLLPGLHFVMPFIEVARSVRWSFVQFDGKRYNRHMYTLHRIDMREAVYDFPKQNVITRDNITMEINALLYYQITDPRAAVYEVSNLPEAIEKLTQTTLRDVIGSMELDESLVSRSMINERLRLILDEATDKWGVKVNRVELQEINPPEDIRHAMEKQMRAERDRRAIILESEGTKRAAILQAEGVKESNMLRAQGEAEAEITRAEGAAQARLKIALAEAEAIKMLQNAAPDADPMPYMIAMQYIKSLPEMMNGKDDKMILVPYEASSLVGSLATIKKVFEQVK
jgi:regulator of protease activity HflC (stomatin/prohibitin superfamily)